MKNYAKKTMWIVFCVLTSSSLFVAWAQTAGQAEKSAPVPKLGVILLARTMLAPQFQHHASDTCFGLMVKPSPWHQPENNTKSGELEEKLSCHLIFLTISSLWAPQVLVRKSFQTFR